MDKMKISSILELLSSLNKIGINLNQIAKYVNTYKTLDKVVLSYLVAIEKNLQTILE